MATRIKNALHKVSGPSSTAGGTRETYYFVTSDVYESLGGTVKISKVTDEKEVSKAIVVPVKELLAKNIVERWTAYYKEGTKNRSGQFLSSSIADSSAVKGATDKQFRGQNILKIARKRRMSFY